MIAWGIVEEMETWQAKLLGYPFRLRRTAHRPATPIANTASMTTTEVSGSVTASITQAAKPTAFNHRGA